MTCCCFWTTHATENPKQTSWEQTQAAINCNELRTKSIQNTVWLHTELHTLHLMCIHICFPYDLFALVASIAIFRAPVHVSGAPIVSKTRDFLNVNSLIDLEKWNKNLRPWPHQPTIQLIVCRLRQGNETQNHLHPANCNQIATCFVNNLSNKFNMCVFVSMNFSRILTVTTTRAASLRATLGHTIPHLKAADSPKRNQNKIHRKYTCNCIHTQRMLHACYIISNIRLMRYDLLANLSTS